MVVGIPLPVMTLIPMAAIANGAPFIGASWALVFVFAISFHLAVGAFPTRNAHWNATSSQLFMGIEVGTQNRGPTIW